MIMKKRRFVRRYEHVCDTVLFCPLGEIAAKKIKDDLAVIGDHGRGSLNFGKYMHEGGLL
jgi:hypothetical protein